MKGDEQEGGERRTWNRRFNSLAKRRFISFVLPEEEQSGEGGGGGGGGGGGEEEEEEEEESAPYWFPLPQATLVTHGRFLKLKSSTTI